MQNLSQKNLLLKRRDDSPNAGSGKGGQKATPEEEKAKADAIKAETEAKEQAQKIAKANKEKRAKAAEKKGYTPKAGAGKMFHVILEILMTQKLKKISSPTIQLMDFGTLILWIKNASRLGFSFGFAHDASIFHTEAQKQQIVEAMKEYARKIPMDTFEYGCENLANSENTLNNSLKSLYKKRAEYIKAQQAEVKKATDIFG